MFSQAYELYCLFWGLNMNMLDTSDVKWIEDKREDIVQLSEKIEAVSAGKDIPRAGETEKKQSAMDKMKAFVRKAVDCCIE